MVKAQLKKILNHCHLNYLLNFVSFLRAHDVDDNLVVETVMRIIINLKIMLLILLVPLVINATEIKISELLNTYSHQSGKKVISTIDQDSKFQMQGKALAEINYSDLLTILHLNGYTAI